MVTIKCQHSGLEFEAETRRTKQHPRIAAAKQQAHKDGLSREMEAALDSVQRSGEYTTIDEYMEQVTAIMRGEEQSAKKQKNARNRAQAERKAAREEALAKREATNRLLKQHGYTWHVDVVDAQDISDAMDTRNTGKTFFLTSPNGEVVSVEQALSAIEQETNSAEKTEVVRVDNALSTEQQTVLTKSMEHTAQKLRDILGNLDNHITVHADSSYPAASFDHDDLYAAWVTVETDDDVTVYHAQNDCIIETFETLADAIEWIKDDIDSVLSDMIREMEREEQLFEKTTEEYFVIARTLWQGDTWTVIASAADKNKANRIAEEKADNGWSEPVWSEQHQVWGSPVQYLKNVVNTRVVTKQQLVSEYGIKLSDALTDLNPTN